MIEFINARTGEVLDSWKTFPDTPRTHKGVVVVGTSEQWEDHVLVVTANAQYLARENSDDVYIRWEAGAGSEGELDTLVTLKEALR